MGWAARAVDAFEKTLWLNPKHAGAQYQMALVKVGSNRPELIEESKKVLTAYLAAHPGNVETMAPLALAQAKLGNKAEAWKLLAAAEEKNPANMRPATILIGYYAAKGDVATAKQMARDLAERLPNSPDAAILRAQVSLAMRDFADTDAQVNRALALESDFRPALQMRLRRALMNQDRAAAEETSQELSKLPEKVTWGAYGRMLFAENKVDQGITEFKRVLREHDHNAALRHQVASLLIGAGRNAEAEEVVDAALKKDPKDKAALLEKTTLEIDAGRLDDATRDAKTLHDMRAFPGQLSYQESRIFAARGQSIKQGDLLAEALKYNPRLLLARIELARLLTTSGRPKNALALLEQTTPGEQQAPRYIYSRDLALISSGSLDEARKSVDAQLAAGKSPGFLYLDAVLRIKAHDMPGARQSLEQSFQMMPDDPPTLRLLGECMSEQKEGLKFAEMLRQAAAKNPKSAILENTLGAQLLAQGDLQGARAAFEAAKAAGDVVDAGIEIATLDLRAGAVEQARQRLLDLIQTHDNARSRLLLAEIEARRGSSADVVVAHYLKALDMEPANALVMNNLAN
jgi:Tfp pilus assembly protein PilF